MIYEKRVVLKDGRECLIRNGAEADGEALLDCFIQTHAETDNLLSYPDECTHTVEGEREFLKAKTESDCEVELLAVVDGEAAGSAGIGRVGEREKVRHRAEFGISVKKAFWRLGIGRALTEACVECAKKASYAQLELEAVADNAAAIALYKSVGFVEYGRNPRAFRSRYAGWQETVLMRLELDA